MIDLRPSASQRVALWVAGIWAAVAVIVGGVFIFGTHDLEYGGDAYSGIQQAAAQTARAIGWLIIGSGVLGVVIALSPRGVSAPVAARPATAEDA